MNHPRMKIPSISTVLLGRKAGAGTIVPWPMGRHRPLNAKVASAVKTVYERLATDALLSRCLRGMTQNANESLHSQIWQRCPKHTFAGLGRVEIAMISAVANFNSGSSGLGHFMAAAGSKLNRITICRGQKRDSVRIAQAERRQSEAAKRRRLDIALATSRAQQEYKRVEGGPSYAPGAFWFFFSFLLLGNGFCCFFFFT